MTVRNRIDNAPVTTRSSTIRVEDNNVLIGKFLGGSFADEIEVGSSLGIVDGKLEAILGKDEVGLPLVDNTSDLDKPVSTAQAAADSLKASAEDLDTLRDLLISEDGNLQINGIALERKTLAEWTAVIPEIPGLDELIVSPTGVLLKGDGVLPGRDLPLLFAITTQIVLGARERLALRVPLRTEVFETATGRTFSLFSFPAYEPRNWNQLDLADTLMRAVTDDGELIHDGLGQIIIGDSDLDWIVDVNGEPVTGDNNINLIDSTYI